MGPFIHVSKITPPEPPEIFFRTRLLNLLRKNQAKKLTLILGQAAQGKSILAASCSRASEIPTAWLNLDAADSDPVNLFNLILQSLRRTLGDIDLSVCLAHPPAGLSSRQLLIVSSKQLFAVFETIPSPLLMVLDNLEQLPEDSPSIPFLQGLIRQSPPHIRFLALSRKVPPPVLDFQDLKMKQDALILSNEDLAFTEKEIKKYFHQCRGLVLSSPLLKRIHRVTEGWIGGIILLAEAMDRMPKEEIDSFFSVHLADRFRREVFQYLGQEIFASLPRDTQDFLIRASLFNHLDPELVRELIGTPHAESILRDHVKKNLFVSAHFDEKTGWFFRYHQLFREFLNAKFDAVGGEEEKKRLHFNAGIFYEKRREPENALGHFLKAGAFQQAATVLEPLGIELLKTGRTHDLHQWIRSFPTTLIEDYPWLLFYRAMTVRHLKGTAGVIDLHNAFQLFHRQGNTSGTMFSLAHLILASIRKGFLPEPINRLLQEGESLLSSIPKGKNLYECAMLNGVMGISHILIGGDVRKGIQACQRAQALAREIPDISQEVQALVYSSFGYLFVGEFTQAEENCRQIQKLLQNTNFAELSLLHRVVESFLANYRGEFEKARQGGEKLRTEIDRLEFTSFSPYVYEILGTSRLAEGALEQSESIGISFLNTVSSLENGLFRGLAHRMLGLTYLHQGRFQQGKDQIEEAIHIFSGDFYSVVEGTRARTIHGFLHFCLKDYDRAENELNEVLQYFERISSHLWIAETHLALALLKWELGNREETVLHLSTGFQYARRGNYRYFNILGGKYLSKACLLVLRLNVKEASGYAINLLQEIFLPSAGEELSAWTLGKDPSLRDRAREILETLHRSRILPLRIEALGGFRVYRGNTPMEERDWDRSQSKFLLMAILSHGYQKVPADLLIEDLWPESPLASGEKNLKITLHRLRKSLEPDVEKGFGSSYIHLQDHSIFLDQAFCHVDFERFLSLIQKGEEAEESGTLKKAVSLYTEAEELYRGDFLPEVASAPWADRKREELRGKFIDLLQRLANLYEKQGAIMKAIACCQKGIKADPLLEESYQKLMTLCMNKGMRNEALKAYEACKKALKVGLNTKPDPTTTALYRKILEKNGPQLNDTP